MKLNRRTIILFAAAVGIVVSAILLKHHYDFSYKSPLCGESEKSGCNVLNRSAASEVFGLPVALIGVIYYGFSFFLALYSNREKSLVQLQFLLSVIALVVDLTLLLYSLFVAGTVCTMCTVTYVVTFAILTASFMEIRREGLGYIPSFGGWRKESFSLAQVSALSVLVVFLTSGYLYQNYSKSQKKEVNKRGGYADHLIIAENEYLRSFQNQSEYRFASEPESRKGAANPVLRIVEFADFLCPHCRVMTNELEKFIKKYPDDVSVTYRHFPLDQSCNRSIPRKFHDGACLLSYASNCAMKQGRFWEMTNEIFQNQQALATSPVSHAQIMTMARSVGLNQGAFEACLASEQPKKEVSMDVEEGIALGLEGTPTIYINGRKMDFNPHLTERLLQFEKQRKQAGPR